MKKDSEKGFSLLEGLLFLIVVIIIGFIGWYVWQAKQKTSISIGSKTTEKSPPVIMKQYVNDEYGFKFEYPETWKLVVNMDDLGRGHQEGTITITSPNDTQVSFSPNLGGKGGDCWDDRANARTTRTCQTLNVLSVEKLASSSNEKQIYFDKGSFTDSLERGGKTLYYIDIEGGRSVHGTGSLLGPIFLSDQISNTKVGYISNSVTGKDDDQNNTEAFFNTREVREATPILKSFELLE
ncbi:MAG TPA: hypothetical protein VJR27_05445 [Candidatus Saccharimonadales bacterium]|nr:hypothetical protein [Candidatus Saccharimonadales bacterium]